MTELSLEEQFKQATEESKSSSPEIPDTSKDTSGSEVSVEDKAREKGWRPKEEFEGDPELWVDADKYLDRGPFIKQIVKLNRLVEEQKQEMNKQKDALNQVKDLMTKAEKAGYEKAKKELNAELDEAIRRGDLVKGRKIMGELEDLRTNISDDSQPSNTNTVNEDREVKELMERRPYLSKPTTVEEAQKCRYAIDMAQSFRMVHPTATMSEEIKFVEEELDKKYPKLTVEDIPKPNTSSAPSTEGVGIKSSGSGKSIHKRWDDLSPSQKNIAKTMTNMGMFKNEGEYVDELIKTGVLK